MDGKGLMISCKRCLVAFSKKCRNQTKTAGGGVSCTCPTSSILFRLMDALLHRCLLARPAPGHCRLLLGRVYVYRDCSVALYKPAHDGEEVDYRYDGHHQWRHSYGQSGTSEVSKGAVNFV